MHGRKNTEVRQEYKHRRRNSQYIQSKAATLTQSRPCRSVQISHIG